MLKAEPSDRIRLQANIQDKSDKMSIKTVIVNFLVNLGTALLKWFGEDIAAGGKHEEQRIKQVVNIEVNGDQPYIKMSDSVKNFLTCDMSENDKINALTQIALFEAAKVDPYKVTIKDGEWYKIHNGQIVESYKGA